jgi:hypothetical protein
MAQHRVLGDLEPADPDDPVGVHRLEPGTVTAGSNQVGAETVPRVSTVRPLRERRVETRSPAAARRATARSHPLVKAAGEAARTSPTSGRADPLSWVWMQYTSGRRNSRSGEEADVDAVRLDLTRPRESGPGTAGGPAIEPGGVRDETFWVGRVDPAPTGRNQISRSPRRTVLPPPERVFPVPTRRPRPRPAGRPVGRTRAGPGCRCRSRRWSPLVPVELLNHQPIDLAPTGPRRSSDSLAAPVFTADVTRRLLRRLRRLRRHLVRGRSLIGALATGGGDSRNVRRTSLRRRRSRRTAPPRLR